MKSAEALDRRVFGRRQTHIRASVRIGYQVVDCTIKDLSEGGALLEFEQRIDLPARVRLSWSDHLNEVVCDVRHVRGNSAGVQFTRPQAFSLRAAVTPAETFKPAAVTALDERPSVTANSLVAERRRTLRQSAGEQSSAIPRAPSVAVRPAAPNPSPASEPPRDLSALKASLQAAALAIVEQREARRVPRPLPASRSAGAPVQPLPLAAAGLVPHPYVMTRSASIAPRAPERVSTSAVPGPLPRPLAASRSAGAPVQPPPVAAAASAPSPFVMTRGVSIAPAAQYAHKGPVPSPLAASAYGVAIEAAVAGRSGCETHACALSVWRRLANLPPSPLPARAYRKANETKVA